MTPTSKETLKERARARRLQDNYKLTLDQYDAILRYQNGVCYACGEAEPVKGRHLSVDHDHATGLVRGLLCSRCNPILGKIERAFIRYGLGKVSGLTPANWMQVMSNYMLHLPAAKALGTLHFGYIGRIGTKAHRKRLRRERKQNTPPHPAITRKEGK